jgi:hypothetical protein
MIGGRLHVQDAAMLRRHLRLLAVVLPITACSAADPQLSDPSESDETESVASPLQVTTVPSTSPPITLRPPVNFCSHPLPFCFAPATSKLVILAPNAFHAALAPLVKHKNDTGIATALVSLETAASYYAGADDAEKVKKAIFWAHENLGTEYVMLVGNARTFPVRHRFVSQPSACSAWVNGTYNPSELYYSNLYKGHTTSVSNGTTVVSHGGAYDNWDANGDGKYDEEMWNVDAVQWNPDAVDGYPDIALGRVPADSAAEVSTYAAKVIAYETGHATAAGVPRFTFFAHAGYANADSLSDTVAANVAPGSAYKLMLDPTSATQYKPGWSAAGNDDVHVAAAFTSWISYVGHGSANGWVGSNFDKTKAAAIQNPSNYPVVVGVACETGQITGNAPTNGTYAATDGKLHSFYPPSGSGCSGKIYDYAQGVYANLPLQVPPPSNYDTAIAEGAKNYPGSWLFNPNGGSIAYFGETLVQPNAAGSQLEGNMLKHWTKGTRVLGDLWRSAAQDYWVKNRTNGSILDAPRIQLGIMTLYGDPSLRMP